jgi:hypothetical protein
VIDNFFAGMGPLATFNAKIEMAYLLKITTKECRRVMHVVRRIRSEFARNLQPLSFMTPRIKDKCGNLIKAGEIEQFMGPSSLPEIAFRNLWQSYYRNL